MDGENEAKPEHARTSRTFWLVVVGIAVAAAATLYVLDLLGIVSVGEPLRTRLASLLAFRENPVALNIVLLLVAAVVVWLAGTKLTTQADVIAQRTKLSQAFVGLLLLATATSLPELATTVTGGVIGNAELVTSNLLGGIVMQTAILAVMDLVLVRKGPLTFFAPDAKLLISGVMLVALLGLVVAGIALGASLSFWGIGAWTIVLFAFFLLILWASYSVYSEPQWVPKNIPQEFAGRAKQDDERLDGEPVQRQEATRYQGVSNGRLYVHFAAGSLAILLAGYVVARAADAIATQTGIGSTVVGAVLVAFTTSLPEVSTTAKAIRLGAYSMAISNIFGSNAFCVALLLVGDVAYRPGPILHTSSGSVLFLTGMGIFVTCAYIWGMLERKNKTVLGMDIASAVVLAVYVIGMVLLYVSGLSAGGGGIGGGGG